MKATLTFTRFFAWIFLFIGIGLCLIYLAERDTRNFPTEFSVRGAKFEVTYYEHEFVVVKKGDPRVSYAGSLSGNYDCDQAQEGFARMVDANDDGKRDFFYYQPCGDDQRMLSYDPETNELTSVVIRPDTDRKLLGTWGREFVTFPAWMLIAGIVSLGFAAYEFVKKDKKKQAPPGPSA